MDDSGPQVPVLGSETVADAMSSFFEFAAHEKSRMDEMSSSFLPQLRNSKLSFAERFCWAKYSEVAKEDVSSLFERAFPDRNKMFGRSC